jgi:coproporphyrinogen III oxidase-like Fe-S oxidoreductase
MALLDEVFDLENIGEISFEMNPYPQDQVYDFIQTFQELYKKVPRIRRSFGIQSFDNQLLQAT